MDIIDQYWIRIGLDGKLQVNAIMQIPMMLIESKNNERYVVSNSMKIIAKNPLPTEYPSLLKLEAPELKVNWKSKNTNIKNKKNKKTDYNNNAYETNNTVNFPWLIKQTRIINSEMLNLGTGYSLVKISWDSNAGFTIKINRNIKLINDKNADKQDTKATNMEESLNPQNSAQENDNLIILLGEDLIKEKMDRLKSLLSELNHKNIYPNKVDLDFLDKATFKTQAQAPKPSL